MRRIIYHGREEEKDMLNEANNHATACAGSCENLSLMVLGFRMTHGVHAGSVLPRIATAHAKGGVRLLMERTNWKDVVLLILLAMFLLLGAMFLVFRPFHRPGQSIGMIITMSGAIATYGGRYARLRRLATVSLVVRPWPISLGTTVTGAFSSRLANPVVKAKLVCLEETKKSGGKFEETKTAVRYESEIDTSTSDWTFDVPVFGVPSLAVKSNRVRWLVQTTITTDQTENPAEFELLVIPEVKE